MILSHYNIKANTVRQLTVALCADLHGKPHGGVIRALRENAPDFIAVAGDLFNGSVAESPSGLCFLLECAEIAPVFYALGNHEMRLGSDDIRSIRAAGVTLLDNEAAVFEEIHIGGLTSAFVLNYREPGRGTQTPDLRFLEEFSSRKGFKILLCHHPEYYERTIRQTGIDLTLSGHAHGGQFRFFGRGVYAPGQGIFPRYTSGVYENRLVVSRGLSNNTCIPRLFNPRELVFIHLT